MTIHGLRLSYTGKELITMAEIAIKYHIDKMEVCKRRVAAFEAEKVAYEADRDAEVATYSNKFASGRSPIDEAAGQVVVHEKKRRFFEHVRDHVHATEDYSLSTDDLSIFGIGPH